jgi:hypothetical protein
MVATVEEAARAAQFWSAALGLPARPDPTHDLDVIRPHHHDHMHRRPVTPGGTRHGRLI